MRKFDNWDRLSAESKSGNQIPSVCNASSSPQAVDIVRGSAKVKWIHSKYKPMFLMWNIITWLHDTSQAACCFCGVYQPFQSMR
jgi:hypothetical protein